MLILLASAKTMDFTAPPQQVPLTEPALIAETVTLAALCRALSSDQIVAAMKVSQAIAETTWERFQRWEPGADPAKARHALFAFNGAVFKALDAHSLSLAQIERAQSHLRIASGLYGLLRPLDAMMPYRLEMNTRLPNLPVDLATWWRERATAALNRALEQARASTLLNLASQEYSKPFPEKQLAAPVVTPRFMEQTPRGPKVIAIHAKRARGLMARHVIVHGITTPQGLTQFREGGYRYLPESSTPRAPLFIRP